MNAGPQPRHADIVGEELEVLARVGEEERQDFAGGGGVGAVAGRVGGMARSAGRGERGGSVKRRSFRTVARSGRIHRVIEDDVKFGQGDVVALRVFRWAL